MQYWRNAETIETWRMVSVLQVPEWSVLEEFCGIYVVGLEMAGGRYALSGEDQEKITEAGIKEYHVKRLVVGAENDDQKHNCLPSYYEGITKYDLNHNLFAESLNTKDNEGEDYTYYLGMAPLYVGMTTRPFEQRIKEHHIIWPLVKWPWIGIRCWPFPIGTPKEYLMELEAVLINKFNPPLNKVRPTVCWGSDKTLFLPAVE